MRGKNRIVIAVAILGCFFINFSNAKDESKPLVNAETYMKELHDTDFEVRRQAVIGLGFLKYHSAVPELIAALDDQMIRIEAARALREINDPRGITAIEEYKKKVDDCGNFLISEEEINAPPIPYGIVEGIITDKHTGMPIEGAPVTVFPYPIIELMSWESRTDKEGHFRIGVDGIGEFFVSCKADGYVLFPPEYYFSTLRHDYEDELKKAFNIFYLKDGEQKKLDIQLQKAGTIEGKIFKKDSSGISPYSRVQVALFRDRAESYDTILPKDIKGFFIENHTFTDENGEFVITNLAPLIYDLKVVIDRLSRNELKGIFVKANERTRVEHIVDLTDPTGVKVKIRLNNKIPKNADIGLQVIKDGKASRFNTRDSSTCKDGAYSCLGMPEGAYRMSIFCQDENGIDYLKKLDIEIVPEKTTILEVNLGDDDKRKK
jgi:hypothetical protein